jgi:hypothetical protein
VLYSERFYERQFITRKKSNCELLARFESVLAQYSAEQNLIETGIPTVAAIAEQLNISPNYIRHITSNTYTTEYPATHSE